MNLLIDVGNSSLKYAFYQHGLLGNIKRITLEQLTLSYFSEQLSQKEKVAVKKIVLASVADSKIVDRISTWAKQANISVEQVFTPAEKFLVKVGYDNYQQLGVDRWLTLVASRTLFPQQNCLIIDLGTATTVDLLRADGQHLGGWIFPGLQTMQASLLTNTANIQLKDNKNASLVLANNTSDNVINGCLAATIGAIELAISQTEQWLPHLEHIVLTGGNASFLLDYFAKRVIIIDDLVFQGLQRYLELN
jgi:type III pantothenate kinase